MPEGTHAFVSVATPDRDSPAYELGYKVGYYGAPIAGIILLVVLLRRRSRARPAAGGAWLPDPNGSGMLRWWNGQAWTEHTMPPPK
jgi:hypothetical protein